MGGLAEGAVRGVGCIGHVQLVIEQNKNKSSFWEIFSL